MKNSAFVAYRLVAVLALVHPPQYLGALLLQGLSQAESAVYSWQYRLRFARHRQQSDSSSAPIPGLAHNSAEIPPCQSPDCSDSRPADSRTDRNQGMPGLDCLQRLRSEHWLPRASVEHVSLIESQVELAILVKLRRWQPTQLWLRRRLALLTPGLILLAYVIVQSPSSLLRYTNLLLYYLRRQLWCCRILWYWNLL